MNPYQQNTNVPARTTRNAENEENMTTLKNICTKTSQNNKPLMSYKDGLTKQNTMKKNFYK